MAVNSVSHTIRILESLAAQPSQSVTELSHAIGTPRATVYRLLDTLQEHGIVLRDGKNYRLSLRLYSLGLAALGSKNLQDIATPLLRKIVDSTKESAHCSLLDGNRVNYIAKAESPQAVRMISYVGWRSPLYSSACGKAILSVATNDFVDDYLNQERLEHFTRYTLTTETALRKELVEVRKLGYALDREETSLGLMCMAVPIKLPNKQLAAFSISGPTGRMKALNKRDVARLLQSIGQQFLAELG